MDAVGWSVIIAGFGVLWLIAPGFRWRVKVGGAAVGTLAAVVILSYPDILDNLPYIVAALFRE